MKTATKTTAKTVKLTLTNNGLFVGSLTARHDVDVDAVELLTSHAANRSNWIQKGRTLRCSLKNNDGFMGEIVISTASHSAKGQMADRKALATRHSVVTGKLQDLWTFVDKTQADTVEDGPIADSTTEADPLGFIFSEPTTEAEPSLTPEPTAVPTKAELVSHPNYPAAQRRFTEVNGRKPNFRNPGDKTTLAEILATHKGYNGAPLESASDSTEAVVSPSVDAARIDALESKLDRIFGLLDRLESK